MTTAKQDGPTLHQYTETRFNLLDVALTKFEVNVDRRFNAIEISGALVAQSLNERFKHVEQLNDLGIESAKRAVDKAEDQQKAINVAQNEWRGTLNDFKSTLISRAEFDRLASDFAAYKLEAARLFSAAAGEKAGNRETQHEARAGGQDTRDRMSLAVAVGVGIIALAGFVMAVVNALSSHLAPQVVYTQPAAK